MQIVFVKVTKYGAIQKSRNAQRGMGHSECDTLWQGEGEIVTVLRHA